MGKNRLKTFLVLLTLASISVGAFGVYPIQAATAQGKSRSSVSIETIVNGEVVQSIKEEKVNGEAIERTEQFFDPEQGIEVKTEIRLKSNTNNEQVRAPQVKAVSYERGDISRRIASERQGPLFTFFNKLINYVLAIFKS